MRHYNVIKALGDTLPSINGKPAGPDIDPMSHPKRVKGFLRSENQPPNPTFLKNWGDVCGEWSKRYGDLVSGWWFDGYKMEMKDSYERLKSERYNIDTWIDAVSPAIQRLNLHSMPVHTQFSPFVQGESCVRVKHLHQERITTFFPRLRRGLGNLLHLRIFLHPPVSFGIYFCQLVTVGALVLFHGLSLLNSKLVST